MRAQSGLQPRRPWASAMTDRHSRRWAARRKSAALAIEIPPVGQNRSPGIGPATAERYGRPPTRLGREELHRREPRSASRIISVSVDDPARTGRPVSSTDSSSLEASRA